ncbi:MAG: hypothetical protein R2818_00545 [Flavobacteriales bacterium]
MEPAFQTPANNKRKWSFRSLVTNPALWWWFALLVSLMALMGMHTLMNSAN